MFSETRIVVLAGKIVRHVRFVIHRSISVSRLLQETENKINVVYPVSVTVTLGRGDSHPCYISTKQRTGPIAH